MTDRPTSLPGLGLLDGEVELGSVQAVFGVRGEVKLYLHNPSSELLKAARRVVLVLPTGARLQARVAARPGAGKRILGRIDGVTDPDAAATLVGARLAIARADLPPTAPDEWYVADLLGCVVIVGEREVGRVREVHHGASYDMLEVDTGAREGEFVVLRKESLVEVDVAGKRIVVAEDAW